MKFNYKHILVATALIATACDREDKLPYPEFGDGVSFRAIATPYISRPQLNASNPSKAVTYNFFSYNADNVSKADIFVSYLPATAVPTALGSTLTYANYVVTNSPAGIAGLIAQVPESGNLPPTINFQRYAQLIAGSTLAASPVTFPATSRVLLRTIQGSELVNNHSFTLNEIVSVLGMAVPAVSSTNIANQPLFFLTFEVYDLEGKKFDYLNGSPSILAGGPQGRAVVKTFVDNSTTPPTNRAYQVMLTGNEGSPFTPGASIRVAP